MPLEQSRQILNYTPTCSDFPSDLIFSEMPNVSHYTSLYLLFTRVVKLTRENILQSISYYYYYILI